MQDELFTLNFDGGSRGNPGPAGIGIVVSAADGTPVVTIGRFLGVATNNAAEYQALIAVMEEALKIGVKKVRIVGDSELVIKQMRGEYRVKNAALKPLYEKAKGLFAKFQQAKFEHNFREKNELADKLANLAMNKKGEVTDVP
jgi:ribonuclease HI